MKKLTKLIGLAILAIVAINILASSNTFAITKTWTGTAGDGLASTAINWSPAGAPVTGDDLIINGSVKFDLGVTVINSVTTNNCSVTLTGSLVIASSITSVGCDASNPYGGLPALSTSVTLAGNVIIDGWDLAGGYLIPPVIDMGNFDLRLVNVVTQAWDNNPEDTVQIVGTGVLTVGRDMPFSGVIMDMGAFKVYVDDLDNVNYTNFAGTIEVVGVVGFAVDRLPSEAVNMNIRQGGIVAFSNVMGDDNAVVDTSINIYSDLSTAFIGGVKLPNVTLYTNTTMIYADVELSPISPADPIVNLTGINLNGFCIEYGLIEADENQIISIADWNDGSAHFIGADMTECAENPGTTDPEKPGVTTPKPPNTGEFIFNNTSSLIIIGITSVLMIGLVCRLRPAHK